ncbi:hypothetical protein SteCoe_11747 [Stentor coeruleus]|uniref:Uncharacterized protein n=1 Tax=Stentor coeruleus TaxID=5963 RepID=A0A1R2CCE0_9CILI|nr:hypothetical protein SteCoe_11747 [Stentor coeruleus]
MQKITSSEQDLNFEEYARMRNSQKFSENDKIAISLKIPCDDISPDSSKKIHRRNSNSTRVSPLPLYSPRSTKPRSPNNEENDTKNYPEKYQGTKKPSNQSFEAQFPSSMYEEISSLKIKILNLEQTIKTLNIENESLKHFKFECQLLRNELDLAYDTIKTLQPTKTPEIKEESTKRLIQNFVMSLSGSQTLKKSGSTDIDSLKYELANEKENSNMYRKQFEMQEALCKKYMNEKVMLEEMVTILKLNDGKINEGIVDEGSVGYLKRKNTEYLGKIIKTADELFEKNMHIKSLSEQREIIVKELNLTKENSKEMPELKQHISFLLQLIRNMRSNIKKAASKHADPTKSKDTLNVSNDLITDISEIARKSKLEICDAVRQMMSSRRSL